MRNVTALFLLCLAFYTAGAQTISYKKVPGAVTAAFAKSFPAVKGAKWSKEDGAYEASFMRAGHKMSAIFDDAGGWKQTETAIPFTKMPEPAIKYLRSHYKGMKIKETAELNMSDGSTQYEAEVKGMDVLFDDKGSFIKTQKA